MTISEIWDAIYNVIEEIWGIPLVILLIGFGLYISIRTGFFQFTGIKMWLKKTIGEMFKKDKQKDGGGQLSPLATISSVLAGTVGSGNIAGVATAIAVGGPGAIFWMILIALVGTMTKMCEVTLAVKFRNKAENGEYFGGPMYYMKKGINGKLGKILATTFAVILFVQVLASSCFVQANTFSSTASYTFKIPAIVSGIVIIISAFFIIKANKIEKIGNVCAKIVPVMVVLYIVSCLIIIISNIQEVPNAIGMIVKYAFAPAPAIGGFAGSSVRLALANGAARGVYSNEAGEGTSTPVHAAAITDHPAHQGMWGIFEVFFDTVIVCSLTALAILTSGAWTAGNLSGVQLTLSAFETVVPTPVVWVIAVSILFFTYTTYLGNYVKFRSSVEYLLGEKGCKYLKYLYLLLPILGVLLQVNLIWQISDVALGFLIIPNMIALIILSPKFLKTFKEYKEKLKKEEKEIKNT